MSSVSGLSASHRSRARDIAVQAAILGLHHASAIHYTQGVRRWEGIARDLKAWKGEFPNYADCSAFVTWCIWNGLDHFGVRDTVNGANWRYGYTGSMLQHGKPVTHISNVVRADAVLYGQRGTSGEHTAIVVGRRGETPMVVSHGSEAGPFFLPFNYRPDIIGFRRYI